MSLFEKTINHYYMNDNSNVSQKDNISPEEEHEIIKFLYEKEIEKTKLLIQKTVSVFTLLAVNGILLATSEDANLFSIIFAFLMVISIIISLAFSTKINSKKLLDWNIEFTYSAIKDYINWLHIMNLKKEICIYVAFFWEFASIFLQLAILVSKYFIICH